MDEASLLQRITTVLILPPGIVLFLLAIGLVAIRLRIRLGLPIIIAAYAALHLMSTDYVADHLERWASSGLDRYTRQDVKPDAIVVLSAGIRQRSAKTPKFDVDRFTLERLRGAAVAHRSTGLPILVSGGPLGAERIIVAHLMKRALENDFGVEVRWLETDSTNTFGNAKYSWQALSPSGVTDVILVTHSWHLPRSLQVFEAMGFNVRPHPVGGRGSPVLAPDAFVPRMSALSDSYYSLYELFGQVWYRLNRPGKAVNFGDSKSHPADHGY